MLRQTQQQKLLQRLSPQQIQLMKLLQVPTAQLEERIKEELEENPTLEYGQENDSSADQEIEMEEENLIEEAELTEDQSEHIDLDDYLKKENQDAQYDYDYGNDDYYPSDEPKAIPLSVENNLQDLLMQQVGMHRLNSKLLLIAKQIIGSIDDDGYLRREVQSIIDDLAFGQNIITTAKEVNSLIAIIRTFDPAGVGATHLQESLLLQAERQSDSPSARVAQNILKNYFEEFSKKHFDKIKLALKLDDETFKQAVHFILRLNPKPGSNMPGSSATSTVYIIPDFFVHNINGELEVTLNSRNAPELRISAGYQEMFVNFDKNKKPDKKEKEAVLFIKQKLDSAKWFIDAIKQRQHTLLSTMQAILSYQKAFFLSGDETNLRPMILKDIAEVTQLDISTVSRVANSKFVQTEFGTFSLKYFFSESMTTDSGEEVSNKEVKRILSDLIAEENKNKPLSDEALMAQLSAKGYPVARRTIAKYREQLQIPVARLRREA